MSSGELEERLRALPDDLREKIIDRSIEVAHDVAYVFGSLLPLDCTPEEFANKFRDEVKDALEGLRCAKMTSRDRLAQQLATAFQRTNWKGPGSFSIEGNDLVVRHDGAWSLLEVADKLLAAGYCKPRTAATEAEALALPEGAVIRSSKDGYIFELSEPNYGTPYGYGIGDEIGTSITEWYLPATVLYVPGEE